MSGERNAADATRAPAGGRRRYAAAALLLLVLFLPTFLSHLHKALRTDHGDWLSIYNIALHSRQTGELAADASEPIVRTQRYPPIARPLLMLMAVPPKSVSAVLSFLLFAACYLVSAACISRVTLSPRPQDRPLAMLVAIGFVLPYAWSDLANGNVTSVLLASVTLAYVLAERGRGTSAGVVLSVGILLKMVPAVCLMHFLVRRQWRVGVGVVVGVVAIGLLPTFAVFGVRRTIDYHRVWYEQEFVRLAPAKTIDDAVECGYRNESVVRTLVRFLTPVQVGDVGREFRVSVAAWSPGAIKLTYAAVMTATAAAWLTFLWWMRRATAPVARAGCYSLCVGAMVWFSPWVYVYYFALAMWPALALLGHSIRAGERSRPATLARAALILWLVALPAVASPFLRACSVHLWAMAVVLLALGLAVRREAVTPPAAGAIMASNP